jgi:hypothetical protein
MYPCHKLTLINEKTQSQGTVRLILLAFAGESLVFGFAIPPIPFTMYKAESVVVVVASILAFRRYNRS